MHEVGGMAKAERRVLVAPSAQKPFEFGCGARAVPRRLRPSVAGSLFSFPRTEGVCKFLFGRSRSEFLVSAKRGIDSPKFRASGPSESHSVLHPLVVIDECLSNQLLGKH